MLAVSQTNAEALLAQLQALYGSDDETRRENDRQRGTAACHPLAARLSAQPAFQSLWLLHCRPCVVRIC